VLFSIADQVFLGGILCLLVSLPVFGQKSKRFTLLLVLGLTATLGAFEIRSIALKQSASGSKIATEINGSSVGERNFHFHYGLSLLEAYPAATLFGIGPGRYGEYVAETGNYPDTVSMQSSEPEVLVEWGVVGLLAWIVFLGCATNRVWNAHRTVGIALLTGLIAADSFQANWKQEAVFLAIAVLCIPHTAISGLKRQLNERVF
jgi:O-antigen ligase